MVVHCLVRNATRFRATNDADAMVPQNYSNVSFANDYLRVYAADPKYRKAIYEAVFGKEGFNQLHSSEYAFVNASFVGAVADLDGVDTPDFDVCRTLNNRTLESIKRERLNVNGQAIWVATVEELLDMKRYTIALYGTDVKSSSRPQDFVDVGILNNLYNHSSIEQQTTGGEGDLFSKLGKILGGR